MLGALRHSSPELALGSHEPERGAWSPCMHGEDARTVSRTIVSVAGDGTTMECVDGQPCEVASGVTRMTLD